MSLFRLEGRTIRGSLNRRKRKLGQGKPLYTIDDMGLLMYAGLDELDRRLFTSYQIKKLPYCFHWGVELPSVFYAPVLDWIREHMQGRGAFMYDPMVLFGYIRLDNEDDAFDFRMRFSEPVMAFEADPKSLAEAEADFAKYGLDDL